MCTIEDRLISTILVVYLLYLFIYLFIVCTRARWQDYFNRQPRGVVTLKGAEITEEEAAAPGASSRTNFKFSLRSAAGATYVLDAGEQVWYCFFIRCRGLARPAPRRPSVLCCRTCKHFPPCVHRLFFLSSESMKCGCQRSDVRFGTATRMVRTMTMRRFEPLAWPPHLDFLLCTASWCVQVTQAHLIINCYSLTFFSIVSCSLALTV